MTFTYGNQSHQQVVEQMISSFSDEYLSEIRKLKNLNKSDLAIWHLCNQWMQAVRGSAQAREDIHAAQQQYVIFACGPILNHLDDSEWSNWTDKLLVYLATLRTFNGSFLGYLWQKNAISGIEAERLNLLMWYLAFVDIFVGTAQYQLKSNSASADSQDASVDIDFSVKCAHDNLNDFCTRLVVTRQDLVFVKHGFNLVRSFPENSQWDLYFESNRNLNILQDYLWNKILPNKFK